MFKLTLTPDQAAYAVTDGDGVISTGVAGGMPRTRRDVLGSVSRVSCTWTLDPIDYRYFRLFVRNATASGFPPFLIDLLLDTPELTEHEAKFVIGSIGLREQTGLKYVVSAELDVKPDIGDELFDENLLSLYEAYGRNDAEFFHDLFNELEILVNVHLPDAME